MSVAIQQDSTYLGHDRWKWSVWVDGPSEKLDQIDYVMYVLDPTFHNPVREVSDRATKFRLEAASWGAFTIHAKAFLKDGTELPLRHEVVLVYPDGTPTTA
jgi:transcription initiation factor IIF auxiliary subunit